MRDAEELERGYLDALRSGGALSADGTPDSVPIGLLHLDHGRRELCGTCACIRLTQQQYAILARLARRVGMIVGRSDLIAAMYADDPDMEPDTADDVLRGKIMELRRAMVLLGDTVCIRTERDVGYAVEVRR